MNESTSNQFIKKKSFTQILFVLIGVFISENGFAEKHWNREYVKVNLYVKIDLIVISTVVYDYLFGTRYEHGYLEQCKFEASVDNKQYFKLMEIHTPQQNKKSKTAINFTNKFDKALLIFKEDVIVPGSGSVWPESLAANLEVHVPNTITPYKELNIVSLGWELGEEFKDVRYIRITGKWHVAGMPWDNFHKVIFDLTKQDEKTLKSNTLDKNMKYAAIKTVSVIKNTEAIAIKGADIGSIIKVYSTSGVEIKSVITHNDVMSIKLPATQTYIVHIGKSRYKVAL